jgi:hypothetical protein
VIEKYINCNFKVARSFDEPVKLASGYSPESYIHPEIAKFASEVEPDSKVCYAHVIAMSDFGHYGSNMNGDGFREDELAGMQDAEEAAKNPGDRRGTPLPRYKTFEDAKFFRHHANSPADQYFGDVPLAVWNDPMKRVELIIRIYREPINPEDPRCSAHPGLAERVDNGDPFSVSMGCKIHHEQCLYCGHENELTKDRCDHLKYRMNDIMPDGKLVAADNFKPRFFDISDVTVPADPIAQSLGKVAEYEATLAPNRARDVAEDVVKVAVWRQKWSEMEKQIPGQTVADMPLDDPCCETTDTLPDLLSESELQEVLDACHGDINAAVSTLSACGMVLSPEELAVLTHQATPANSPEFNAPTSVSLDKFSNAAYHLLKPKLATRSGFVAPCPTSGWEPQRLMEMGGEAAAEMADYYAYYRKLASSFPVDLFIKVAHCNSAVREIQGGQTDHSRVKAAMYYLAYAGLATG